MPGTASPSRLLTWAFDPRLEPKFDRPSKREIGEVVHRARAAAIRGPKSELRDARQTLLH
jgi:hypothetical protein